MKSPAPNSEDVAMVRWLRDQIAPGERPRIISAWDDSEEHFVDVMTAEDTPAGFSTVTTISLHRHPNLVNGRDVRTEIIAMLQGDRPEYALLLGSAGLNVAKDSFPLWPGVVHPGIVDLMVPGHSTSHLMFTAPGTFPELNRYEMASGQLVHWLQAIPIHESERLFLQREGLNALEDALERADAQIGDLDRPPVV